MRLFFCIALTALTLCSCGSARKVTSIETAREKRSNLAGETVMAEAVKLQGIEMGKALSEDGTKMVEIPYKWYLGIGTADIKQMAIELAQREAYSTISRIIANLVDDSAERGNVGNNGKVQQALSSHWEQISVSLQQGCEPFGDVIIEYNPTDRMYTAHAKIAVRGDKYNQLLNSANTTPKDLSGSDLQSFLDINEKIIEAAKAQ